MPDEVNVQDGTAETPPPAPETTPTIDLDTIDPQVRESLIEQYLTAKPHEELSKIPGYNKAIQRKLSKLEVEQRGRLQQEQQQQAQRGLQLQQADKYFSDLAQSGQLYEALQDDRQRAAFDEVQKWKKQGGTTGFDEKTYLANAVRRFKESLSEKDDFEDAPWDDIESKTDLGESLAALAEHATKKRGKQMEKELETLIEKRVQEAMAKLAQVSDQPDSKTGGTPTSGRTFTLAEIKNMPWQEFQKREAEIDAAAREGRIK